MKRSCSLQPNPTQPPSLQCFRTEQKKMEKEAEKHPETRLIPRVKLGSSGLEVSRLGLGCMNLAGLFDAPSLPEDVVVSLVKEAFSRGCTFFDTADVYGPHTNELMLGKALKQLPRKEIQVASKCGIVKLDKSGLLVKGTPEYIRACCESSLQRLGLDYIDLYYQHRIDTSIPIEVTMGGLKKLVEEGKVKYIGLSEASPDTLRRAHAVHPITALQIEWSLWTRDIEEEIVPLCRELGIGIVPYSPLGRGFFGGKGVVEKLPANSALNFHPRFAGVNLEKNKVLYERLRSLAATQCCTTTQLALAWLLHQGDDVVPIPGTTNINHLLENIASVDLNLTRQVMEDVSNAVPLEEVAGQKTYESVISYTWKFADTPSQAI